MKKWISMVLSLVMVLTLVGNALAAAVAPSKTTGDMVQAEVTMKNEAASAGAVFEVVTTIVVPEVDETTDPAEDAAAPEESKETSALDAKRAESVEACNNQLQTLLTALQTVTVPTVPAATEETIVDGDAETVQPEDAVEGALTDVVEEPAVDITPEQQKEIAIAQTKVIEEYFGDVVSVAGEATTLTAILGTETATVQEFFPVVVAGFEKDCGDATMKLTATKLYTVEDKVTVLVGLVAEDGTVTWQECETVVAEDGTLQIMFTEETLLAIQNGTALLAVVGE